MSNNQETVDPPVILRKYDTTLTPPRKLAVSIYIDGLLCLGFPKSQCAIAYLQPVADHVPAFGIWQKNPCGSKYTVDLGTEALRTAADPIKIKVKRTGSTNKVEVYDGPELPAIHRYNYPLHCN